MKNRHCSLVILTSAVCAAAVLTATLTAPSAPVLAQGLGARDQTQVKALYAEKCSACHNLPDPADKEYTRRQWQQTVDQMLTKYHASDSISPTEATQIVGYLATFAPKREPNTGGQPGDPWGAEIDDVWENSPTASRVFNFTETALPGLSPLGAGAPGPAPSWRIAPDKTSATGNVVKVSLPQPSVSRYALLMDRCDQGRNLDIKVRFHILQGKVSPSVGIVFGFAGPKNYSVLRYDQAKNDLALISVAEPAHTLVQDTPLAPISGPDTASLAANVLAPIIPGWHTLRLMVKDGRVRGWIDMNKRINVADPTYTGGKVGLWTQGDTIAVFSNLSVDLYDTLGTTFAVPSP